MIRKSLIYKTKVPGGDYALNHALGCSHGCTYPCFAYALAMRHGRVDSYEAWVNAEIVENAPILMDRELASMGHRIKNLHMGLTMDPFMVGRRDICQMSRDLLLRAAQSRVRCTVLTKGVLPADLALLSPANEYGISVVTLNEDFRRRYEPGAAPIAERIGALRALHDRGAATYVHIAPYPTPNMIRQSLPDLLEAVSFVDRMLFGRLNYSSLPARYPDQDRFYADCARQIAAFCEERGIHLSGKREAQTVPASEQLTFFE